MPAALPQRDFFVNGPALVKIKGNGALANATTHVAALHELGLSSDAISITPRFVYKPQKLADYGDDIAPDTIWMMADCTITMTLIYFNPFVLRGCLMESMAGGGRIPGVEDPFFGGQLTPVDGVLPAAGTPMGAMIPLMTSGNHYMSLNILSPNAEYPWRFPASCLAEQPMEMPLGTAKSMVKLTWKAIPYPNLTLGGAGQKLFPGDKAFARYKYQGSSGAILWTHTLDT